MVIAVALLLLVISNVLWAPADQQGTALAQLPGDPAPSSAPPSTAVKATTAAPQGNQAVKADLLRACGNAELDPADFKLGALIDDGQGHKLVVASTTRTIAMCGVHPLGSGSGVGPMTEATLRNAGKVLAKAGGIDADTGFLGYGRTLPGITKVEIFLPGGKAVLSNADSETFAYFVPLPRDKITDLTARVTDDKGTVVYNGPL
ncbi:hypothetical protein [Umezawaea sp. Da 62-37]|uniref:hypothetical protein n=1 Tax=Umezawaea sp. Da 62-37 TaxID=3075927 RepID=UPI0028F6E691|nr:hypothetical protein [Umezawaea sp. Da 62-37]WNV86785.1 hypothetical protein RM788_00415 [Umezawaea sp. Da 62-37]